MGEIILVRHGQANSTATDDASYDRLSPLGHKQGGWLGEWLRAQDDRFDLVLSGSLRRHRETAAAMGHEPRIDPRLNEIDYFNLSRALTEATADGATGPAPGPEDFANHIARVMEAWHRAEIRGHETFAEFEERVTGLLQEAAMPGRRVLCVTSGGVIGMVLRGILGLDPRRLAQVLIPIWNTSIHRFQVTPQGTILAGFNAIPHLEGPTRAHARTHY